MLRTPNIISFAIIFLFSLKTVGQNNYPLSELQRIFRNYTKYNESVDSEENKIKLEKALKQVEIKKITSCIPIIIDIYLYYDPTDFPAHLLIEQTLKPIRSSAVPLIRQRLRKELKKNNNPDLFPAGDLTRLLDKLITFINPTGSYQLVSQKRVVNNETYGYSGDIQVSLIDSSHINISLFVSKGAPSYNTGSFDDTLEYKGNQAIYTTDMDATCKIIFTFNGKGIEVEELAADFNTACGFGHAVVASGFYKKILLEKKKLGNISPNKPQLLTCGFLLCWLKNMY